MYMSMGYTIIMVKKMIYLEEGMDRGLERIARVENKSVSELIREAIRRMFQSKEYFDLALYDKRMAEYLGKPSSAAAFRDVMDD